MYHGFHKNVKLHNCFQNEMLNNILIYAVNQKLL